MINISEELKNIYKNDIVPLTASPSHKKLTLYFPNLDYTITNDRIKGEEFSLTESICQSDDLVFGSCESAQLKVTVANVDFDLSGQKMVVTQTINGVYSVSLGTFTVKSCERQGNKWFRDIIAYDNMKKFEVDVADWYESLNFPMSLKTFRNLLCAHVGVEYENSNLPNDGMAIVKTISPKSLIAKQVLIACEELNGAFGHIGRNGILRHITLSSATVKETYSKPMCKDVAFEEYMVQPIDSVQIRQEEGDIGAFIGGTTNTYVINGNFLVYGKTHEELSTIATNVLTMIGSKPYKSVKADTLGLPYVEVGDYVLFDIATPINTFVLERTINGVQALRDNIEANGHEFLKTQSGINEDIIQLKGRSAVLNRTVEELSNTIINLEDGLQSEILQTAENINLRIEQMEKTYNSSSESTQGDGVPTLENYPAMNWVDAIYPGEDVFPYDTFIWTYSPATYDKHLGTIYYDNANSKAYRFVSLDGVHQWKEITDALTTTILDKVASLELTTDNITLQVGGIETKVNEDFYTKTETQSLIDLTSTSITQTVSTTYETKQGAQTTRESLQSQITQSANAIELKVDKNGLISTINQSAEEIKINASKITFEGLVTANNNFKILEDGSIEARNGRFSGDITGSTIYLELNNDSTSLYGTTGSTNYKIISFWSYLYNGFTRNWLVLGNSSVGTKIEAFHFWVRSENDVSIQGDEVSLSSYYNGSYWGVRLQNRVFRPMSTNISLGSSSYRWTDGYFDSLDIKRIYHSGGNIGFFGEFPIAQKTVTKLSTNADLSAVISKVNSMLDAFGNVSGYGLLDL